MGAKEILEFFASEGRTIRQAKVTFGTALTIIGIAIWGVLSWRYSGQIDNLQSQLVTVQGQLKSITDNFEARSKLKDEQLAVYKGKLGDVVPDEAKARIQELEKQIRALSPRHLTAEQKTAFREKIASLRANINLNQDMAVADAKGLVVDFRFLFQSAGWTVLNSMIMGIGNPPPTGIALHVADPSALQPPELAVKQALDAANIQFDIQGGFRPMPFGPKSDVELLITSPSN